MSVRQVAEYLHLNEKKIYSLVSDGSIPATKVTGKWMFPRELVDRWMLDSSHGGLLTDRLIIAGSDDPLLSRLITAFARDTGVHALISYTPTGSRLGLELLQASRVDACGIRWGPNSESNTRHPALLRQYSQHHNWVLIRAFRREQGLIVSPPVQKHTNDPKLLFDNQFRWVLRQKGSGAQRFLLEVLTQYGINAGSLNSPITGLSEREAAAAITMDLADVGPGSRATATEYGLGFISFGWESFDFALPRGIWFRHLFQDLLMRIKSASCLEMADILGGYEFINCGDLVWGDD
ncbi:MAG: helix-turn-helix transcriptional regulator [Gammaproteobacteria bacterium]|nr:helix-turn-helix transcriptional regulator [Gammaproteobacteria bacterium]